MRTDNLSLAAIDGMRHLTASEDIVAAVVFAAKNGHGTTTAYRFVTALVMTNTLTDIAQWRETLERVTDLEGRG
jgi:hypothetical protein